MILIISDTKLL